MKIKYLGHASFLITSDKGVKIITDPYKPGCFNNGIRYSPINEPSDIVTISHEHDDHNETKIQGNPVFVRGAGKKNIKDVTITGIDVYHDESQGKERGKNTIFNMSIDEMNIVHLGDIGHALSTADVQKIGNVDVLLVPVGGYFTVDAKLADDIIKTLKPKVIIPMHFKTSKCGFPIAPVDDFTRNKAYKKVDGEIAIEKGGLPPNPTIYVLTPTK